MFLPSPQRHADNRLHLAIRVRTRCSHSESAIASIHQVGHVMLGRPSKQVPGEMDVLRRAGDATPTLRRDCDPLRAARAVHAYDLRWTEIPAPVTRKNSISHSHLFDRTL